MRMHHPTAILEQTQRPTLKHGLQHICNVAPDRISLVKQQDARHTHRNRQDTLGKHGLATHIVSGHIDLAYKLHTSDVAIEVHPLEHRHCPSAYLLSQRGLASTSIADHPRILVVLTSPQQISKHVHIEQVIAIIHRNERVHIVPLPAINLEVEQGIGQVKH